MGVTPEELARAGLIERNGKLERIQTNDDAKGPVRDTGALSEINNADAARDTSAARAKRRGTKSSGTELPHTEQKEQQAVVDEAAEWAPDQKADTHYQAGVSKVDGESAPKFRISVVIHVSNRARRDPTGALETICDIVVTARRRLSERLAGRIVESGKLRARKRGGHDSDRAVVKGPLPF